MKKVVNRKPAQRNSDAAKKRSGAHALARDAGSLTAASKSNETVNKSDACEVPVWTLSKTTQENAAAAVKKLARSGSETCRIKR
jgi:hypothetical protein